MLFGPQQDQRLIGLASGPKRIGFNVSTHFSWVWRQDPMLMGLSSGPKRIGSGGRT